MWIYVLLTFCRLENPERRSQKGISSGEVLCCYTPFPPWTCCIRTNHFTAYDMSGIALGKPRMLITVKKWRPIHSGKIHYFVGYDAHYEIYGVIKEIVPSILKHGEAYRNVIWFPFEWSSVPSCRHCSFSWKLDSNIPLTMFFDIQKLLFVVCQNIKLGLRADKTCLNLKIFEN